MLGGVTFDTSIASLGSGGVSGAIIFGAIKYWDMDVDSMKQRSAFAISDENMGFTHYGASESGNEYSDEFVYAYVHVMSLATDTYIAMKEALEYDGTRSSYLSSLDCFEGTYHVRSIQF